MVKIGDFVVSNKDMSSQYITPNKLYMVQYVSPNIENVFYQITNDKGWTGMFYSGNFISMEKKRNDIIEDILC